MAGGQQLRQRFEKYVQTFPPGETSDVEEFCNRTRGAFARARLESPGVNAQTYCFDSGPIGVIGRHHDLTCAKTTDRAHE